ncbi:hypothetical protein [Bradyrhizobium commune]|uniref:Uncharacterized protein n=1 Tax=Bradyrhizobium commune TaxID=83627 RepID=A0A7S9D760_9BRAD|nr:hypothetical protein [Bradyrhizobium commune]QPF92438.1 hypothetical protein IC761_03840 [Bradyrhizobium commune]
MRFFLCEIVARIVAIYLFVDCVQKLRDGYAERKIRSFNHDFLVSLLDWTGQVFERDNAPARYWMEMGHQAMCLLGCVFVTIFGWWTPTG